MKFPWFKRRGLLYFPGSILGWVIFLCCLAYSVYSFIEIDSKSHSVSDTLMNFVFRMFLIYCGYTLIAFLSSLKTGITLIAVFLGFSALVHGQGNTRWDKWSWLTGEWVGEGGGQTGQGSGKFSLMPDLNGNILVRKNQAEYPATEKNPAIFHEDLMIIYPGNNPELAKAVYFDNEGHIINYTVSSGEKSIILTSEKAPDMPVFRLTYQQIDTSTINVKFEMSQDGQKFFVYTEGRCRKVK